MKNHLDYKLSSRHLDGNLIFRNLVCLHKYISHRSCACPACQGKILNPSLKGPCKCTTILSQVVEVYICTLWETFMPSQAFSNSIQVFFRKIVKVWHIQNKMR